MNLRENWRIVLLIVLVVLSGIALFVPQGSATEGPTNLEFGLELSGGTRLRAELVGQTAEGLSISPDEVSEVKQTVFGELGVDPFDVTVRVNRQGPDTVEVLAPNVSKQAFANALQEAGLDASVGDIRNGVTQATRERATKVLTRRINQGGLTGGSVAVVGAGTSQFIVVEVPGANRSEVLELIGEPGRVQIVALHPIQGDNGTVYKRTPLLTQGDFAGIRPAQQPDEFGGARVPVTLTSDASKNFTDAMQQFGFTSEGVGRCRYDRPYDEVPENPGWCLLTVVDGEVVYAASMSSDLARDLRPGSDGRVAFLSDPSFTMTTGTTAQAYEQAQELRFNLISGALPTELDIQSELYLAPSLAQKFKPLALITGLVAWLVVSGVVFVRYREIKVAIPMLLTAAAEVFLLLGFAAGVGLAIDLSHIAGFIAVIGTGVDDLVIIADEILQRGEISTGRVFQNRFRKAFWVIGAAAATTIIAMSPLAIFSLGDLQGFAIITIIGVLIGVLVTRPAYGNVLRNLLVKGED